MITLKCLLRFQKRQAKRGWINCDWVAKRRNVKQPSPFVRKSESEKAKGKYLGTAYICLCVFQNIYSSDIMLVCGRRRCQHSHAQQCPLEEHDVEARPECIPMKCLDENICVSMVKKYFTIDAWMVVQNVMEVMQARRKWDCAACSLLLSTRESVACESCLNWFHLKCVGLKKAPKKKNWFCVTCHKT